MMQQLPIWQLFVIEDCCDSVTKKQTKNSPPLKYSSYREFSSDNRNYLPIKQYNCPKTLKDGSETKGGEKGQGMWVLVFRNLACSSSVIELLHSLYNKLHSQTLHFNCCSAFGG